MSDMNQGAAAEASGELASGASNLSSSAVDTTDAGAYPEPRYAWYCVFILLGIYMNSFLDRQILALLVGFIKKDMALSDTAVGFLMGPAFAIFYTLGGLPLGIMADRVSRRWLVGIGQFFWSIASVCFGMGRGYPQLLGARIGVGVGEASLSPAAYSLVSDLFPPNRLGTALAVYGMGIYFGTGAAFLGGAYFVQWVYSPEFVSVKSSLGPWFADRKNWQLVFLLIAMPTIPLSLLLLTVKEPSRKGGHVTVPFRRFVGYAWSNRRTLLAHNVGFGMLSFTGYGAVAWTPTFMARIHGVPPSEFGKMFGLVIVVAGVLGIWAGGSLSDRLRSRGVSDAKMRVGFYGALFGMPFSAAVVLMPNADWAYAMMWPSTFFAAFPWGIAPAALQEIMPNRMRGQASAVYLFIVNLLGLALGPLLVAVVTDSVFKDEMMIHYSMLLTGAVAGVASIVLLGTGLKHFRDSVLCRSEFELNGK